MERLLLSSHRACPARFKHQGIVGFHGEKLLLERTLTDAAIYLMLYSVRPDNDNTVTKSIYSYTLGIHIRKGHYTLSSSFNNDSETQGFWHLGPLPVNGARHAIILRRIDSYEL